MHRDAPRPAFGERLAPAGLLCCQLERREVPRVLLQQPTTQSSKGSWPAALATSSRNVSVEKPLWV